MNVKKMTVKDKDGNTITQEFDIPKMLEPAGGVPQPNQIPPVVGAQGLTPAQHGAQLNDLSDTTMIQQGLEYAGQLEQQRADAPPPEPESNFFWDLLQQTSPTTYEEGRLDGYTGGGSQANQRQRIADVHPTGNQVVKNFESPEEAAKRRAEGGEFNSISHESAIPEQLHDAPPTPKTEEPVIPKRKPTQAEIEPIAKKIDEATSDEKSIEEANSLADVDDKKLKEKGEELETENPGFFDRVTTALGNAFDNMLNDDELATSAILYLGSRALGYSHGGSVRYAGQAYLNQWKSAQNNAQGFHAEGKHTKDSIEAYKQSWDTKDLVPIKAAPALKVDRTDPIMGQVIGSDKQVKMYVAENDNGDKIFVDGKGKPIDTDKVETDPYKVPGSQKYNERLYKARSNAVDQFKSLQKQFGTFGEGDEKTTFTNLNPQTAGAQVGRWATEAGIDPNEAGVLASQAYEDMRTYAIQSKTKPRDIRPFLNQLVIRNRTGAPELFEAKGSTADEPQYVDANKLAGINNKIADVMKANGATGNVNDIANLFYNKKIKEWTDVLTQEQRDAYTGSANDNESGFYLFMVDKLGIDHRIQK